MRRDLVAAAGIVSLAVVISLGVPAAALQALALAVGTGCLWVAVRGRLLVRLPVALRRAADLSLVLTVLSSPLRTAAERMLYGRQADAEDYALFGHRIAEAWRSGGDASAFARAVPGTGVIDYVSGGLAFLGQDPVAVGGFMSALLGFAARVLFVIALHRLVERDGRPVGRLAAGWMCALLLLPSLLYWPAALGKEGWMMMSVAVATFGVANLARGHRGIGLLGTGSLMAALIRPHVALMLLLAAGVAWAVVTFYRSVRFEERVSPVVVIRVAAFVVLTAVAVANVQGFFLLDSVDDVDQVLEEVSTSAQRGTYRENPGIGNVADLPAELAAVLVRPHPLEAEGLAMLMVSLELTALWGVALAWWLRSGGRPKRLADLYVVFAAAYAMIFVVLFSNMGNFGQLARQRVQLLPVLLIGVIVVLLPDRAPDTASEASPAAQAAAGGG